MHAAGRADAKVLAPLCFHVYSPFNADPGDRRVCVAHLNGLTKNSVTSGLTKRQTILVADDHPVFRRGLVQILEEQFPRARLIDAGNGSEALIAVHEHKPTIAILDVDPKSENFGKILIDMPDFAASILFADAEEFAVRRALRARTLVTNGTLTQEEVERAEEAIEPLYDEVASIVTDVAQGGGKPTEMPDANIWKGERFKKLLRESRDITQTMGEIPVHEMAVKLRDRFLELDKAMGDRLMHFFGFNQDPELEKEETAAKDERNRARSRRDQLVAIAKTRDETNKFNAQADEAAKVVQEVTAGLPIDKETLYGRKPKKRRRWGSKM